MILDQKSSGSKPDGTTDNQSHTTCFVSGFCLLLGSCNVFDGFYDNLFKFKQRSVVINTNLNKIRKAIALGHFWPDKIDHY